MRNGIIQMVSAAAVIGLAVSPALADPTVYVPLGESGKILVMDGSTDKAKASFSGTPAVHGLAGTAGWKYLVAGSYDERERGADPAPPKPAGVSQADHEAHHAKKPAKAGAGKDYVSFLSILRLPDGAVTRRIEVPGAVHHTAVVPGGQFAISTHPNGDGVSVVNLAHGMVAAVVRTGPSPNYVVVSPDGKKAYVSNSGNDTVSEIDTKYWTVARRFEVGEGPEHLALSSDGKTLYVANADDGTVSIISVGGGKVAVETVRIGGMLHGIDVSDDGKTLFVVGREQNKIVAIDLRTKAVKSKPLGPEPYHLTAIKGTGKLYVSSAEENKVWVLRQEDLSLSSDFPVQDRAHQMVVFEK